MFKIYIVKYIINTQFYVQNLLIKKETLIKIYIKIYIP